MRAENKVIEEFEVIQIQLLLKLNAREINPYGFYYTIKSIDKQGF